MTLKIKNDFIIFVFCTLLFILPKKEKPGISNKYKPCLVLFNLIYVYKEDGKKLTKALFKASLASTCMQKIN